MTVTFSNVQVDTASRTIHLTVSGSGLRSAGQVATAQEQITGAPPQTATAPLS
jgi:hypothetical protein